MTGKYILLKMVILPKCLFLHKAKYNNFTHHTELWLKNKTSQAEIIYGYKVSLPCKLSCFSCMSK